MGKIEISRHDAALLGEGTVEFNNGANRWPIKAGLSVDDSSSPFEAFTRHPRGVILPMGAFSYAVEGGNDLLMYDIGRYCSIARGVRVVNGNHPLSAVTTSPYHFGSWYQSALPEELRYRGASNDFPRGYGRGAIGHDVWIGGHVVLRSGLQIGHGAVVASGSVVVKDVAPFTIVGGNPARPIRKRFSDSIIDSLLELAWWDYDPSSFSDLDMYDVESFISAVRARGRSSIYRPFTPQKYLFTSEGLTRV